MTSRAIAALHNEAGDRCVKIMRRADGTFGFDEFRKDPEDAGGWMLVGYNRHGIFATAEQATVAARSRVGWLRDMAPAAEATASLPRQPKAEPTPASRVVVSLHNDEVDRCVDIIRHPDGTFGFKEFRRDPEDRGGWTLVSYNPRAVFASQEQAAAAARVAVAWLHD
jgi:hypothetical protein